MKTTAHDRAWKHFVEIGEIPAYAKKRTWHLHHVDPILKYFDPDRYAQWRIEDLQPMTSSDHSKLHRYL